MNQHTPIAYRAANDRAPREKRSPLLRFAELVGQTLFCIYFSSIVGVIISAALEIPDAAMMFIGAGVCAALTAVLVEIFKGRIGG